MTLFEETIKAYLDERAETDLGFSLRYMKKNKSIEECCRYICEEVQKTGRMGFADAEIYGMAIHYYDEDDLKVGEKVDCKVIVNREIQLTEEEKKEIEEKARKEIEQEEMEKAKGRIRAEREKEAKKKAEDEKKRREKIEREEKDGVLFLF